MIKTLILNSHEIFVVAAAVLILGFILSRLINLARFPKVTGYILTGIIFGPYILNIFNLGSLEQLDFLPKLALGIIAFIIGAGLSFELIAKLKWQLIALTLFESLTAAVLVCGLLLFFKVPLGAALALAAIAAATAPAATIAVIREFKAHGPLTETTLAVVALDDAVAIILFGFVLTLNPESISFFGQAAMNSLSVSMMEILQTMLMGVVLGILAHVLTKISKEAPDNTIIILGIILLGIGFATVLGISSLLTNMFLGLTFINLSRKNIEIVSGLERILPPIYCLFFVLAGAHLEISIFFKAGLTMLAWALIFVFARIVGKMLGAYAGGTICRSPDVIRKYLGLTLAPQAGVAIGLSLLISAGSGLYALKAVILNVTLMGVAINEIIGPVLTKIALFKAKEATVE